MIIEKQSVLLASEVYDRIRVNIEPIQISQLLGPLINNEIDHFSRINCIYSELKDFFIRELGELDFIYGHVKQMDNRRMMIFNNYKPLYHTHHECSIFKKELYNFSVPDKIMKQGMEHCMKFRLWIKSNWDRRHDFTFFNSALKSKFNVEMDDLVEFNTGACISVLNVKLDNLEESLSYLFKKYTCSNQSKKRSVDIPDPEIKNRIIELTRIYLAIKKSSIKCNKGYMLENFGVQKCPECFKNSKRFNYDY